MQSAKTLATPTNVSSADAEAIVRSFNTWAYKREQPSCLLKLGAFVARAITRDAPIPFVLYWGKGPRCSVSKPEIDCLDYLASMAARISKVYARGAHFTLVQTDTHALHNGHSAVDINQYFADVTRVAAERNFKCCRLGSLSPLSALVGLSSTNIEVSPESLQRLVEAAARWYRGGATVQEGARRYYAMNMVEKRAIAEAFPESIFITFNGSKYRDLFPDDLPVFYMYSIRRGIAVKPWFMNTHGSAQPATRDSSAFDAECAP